MKKNLIGVMISLVFLGLLFFLMRGQVPEIISALKNANHGLIFLSAAIFLLTTIPMGLRLQMVFGTKDIKIKLSDTANLTFIGYFFNNFLPTSVGGDFVKAMCAARLTQEPIKSFTAVMMDRIFGLFTFILIPSASLFFLRGKIDHRVPVIVYSFLVFSMVFFIFLFNRDIARRFSIGEDLFNRLGVGPKIRQIYDELHDFKNHKGVATAAMLLSLVGQSISIFVMYLLAVALGADPHLWIYFFLLVPVVQLISMLPSLNGLGIREGAYIYFLKNYIGSEKAAAIGILGLGLLLLFSIVGGIIYLLRRDYQIHFSKINSEGKPNESSFKKSI